MTDTAILPIIAEVVEVTTKAKDKRKRDYVHNAPEAAPPVRATAHVASPGGYVTDLKPKRRRPKRQWPRLRFWSTSIRSENWTWR